MKLMGPQHAVVRTAEISLIVIMMCVVFFSTPIPRVNAYAFRPESDDVCKLEDWWFYYAAVRTSHEYWLEDLEFRLLTVQTRTSGFGCDHILTPPSNRTSHRW